MEAIYNDDSTEIMAYKITPEEMKIFSYLKKEDSFKTIDTIAYHTGISYKQIKKFIDNFLIQYLDSGYIGFNNAGIGLRLQSWIKNNLNYAI